MNQHTSIRDQSCPNKICNFYLKLFQENVVVHSKKEMRMKCKKCLKTWVIHRKHWNYGLKTHPEKVRLAKDLLQKGLSIRKVAKEVGVSPSTIQMWKRRIKF